MQTKTYILQAAPASISVRVRRRAADIVIEAAPADGSAPKLPRFSMVAYTGGPMRPKMNPPLKHPVVVDLAGLDISSQNRPALKDHNPQMLVGHTDSIASDGRQLTATGVISGVGPRRARCATPRPTGSPGRSPWGRASRTSSSSPPSKP
jgi:hypothetical protein